MTLDPSGEVNQNLVEHKTKTVTRWWVTPRMDFDRYDVFVLKYKIVDNKHVKSWNLNLVGDWEESVEGGPIIPCLTLNGKMIHALADGGPIDRGNLAEELERLAKEIVKSLPPELTSGLETPNCKIVTLLGARILAVTLETSTDFLRIRISHTQGISRTAST